jgi:hypothetical protein
MAENVNMSLNHLLCFIFSKLHKSNEKYVKNAVLTFYTPSDIHKAKELLLSNVSSLKDFTTSTRVRDRRDADGRAQRELDDIYCILYELDEKNMLQLLPTFVSDCPDFMPTSHLVEGDLRAIMIKFDKLEQCVSSLQQSFNSISAAMTISTQTQGQVNVQSTITAVGDNNKGCKQSRGATMNEIPLQPLLSAQGVWADTITSDTGESSTSEGWVNAGRRSKRRRMRSSQQMDITSLQFTSSTPGGSIVTNQVPNVNPKPDKVNLSTQTKKPASTSYAIAASKPANTQTKPHLKSKNKLAPIIGRSRASVNENSARLISAAKPYISKATFCVDNVSTNTSIESMVQFVTAMDIDVLGCYEVNPRRTYWQRQHEIYPDDRKTFRVCIPKEDSGRFLVPKKWPAHISVSLWQFRKTSADGVKHPTQDKNEAIIETAQSPQSVQSVQSTHHLFTKQLIASSKLVNTLDTDVINVEDVCNILQSTPAKLEHTSMNASNLEDLEETIITKNGDQ